MNDEKITEFCPSCGAEVELCGPDWDSVEDADSFLLQCDKCSAETWFLWFMWIGFVEWG